MLKLFSLLVVSFILSTSTAVFAESQSDNEQKCKQWAQEEAIEADEMDAYVAECIKSITEEMEQESK
ncbi:MAG: hypothetical protein OQK78_07620 [Gammaproteobacteria bacterium]|nr:hypothetical protein [Gammaproteobacteria bacterium]MCW8887470.1 hypothetical protein [Gammaproteobacteria bacterium]